MSYVLTFHDWSQFDTPSNLSGSDLQNDTHANDPDSPGYNSNAPSWIGETFTFNGGAPTTLYINDDDGNFEDGYVETGSAQTLDVPLTLGGVTYPAGSVVQNEFSMTDATGQAVYVIAINGQNVGFGYQQGELPAAGDRFTATQGYDGDPFDSGDGTTSSTSSYSAMACFTPGTRILTPQGARDVSSLTAGDRVLTTDAGAQPIRIVLSREIDFNTAPDTARPILIRKGAFSEDIPRRDIVVSPQHGFVFEQTLGTHVQMVLVPAKALTVLPGIRAMPGKRSVHYVHLVLPRHHILTAEGALTESCYLGPVMQANCTAEQRRQIARAFPLLQMCNARDGYGPRARPALTVHATRRSLEAGTLRHCPPQLSDCTGSATTNSARGADQISLRITALAGS